MFVFDTVMLMKKGVQREPAEKKTLVSILALPMERFCVCVCLRVRLIDIILHLPNRNCTKSLSLAIAFFLYCAKQKICVNCLFGHIWHTHTNQRRHRRPDEDRKDYNLQCTDGRNTKHRTCIFACSE